MQVRALDVLQRSKTYLNQTEYGNVIASRQSANVAKFCYFVGNFMLGIYLPGRTAAAPKNALA